MDFFVFVALFDAVDFEVGGNDFGGIISNRFWNLVSDAQFGGCMGQLVVILM